MNNVICILIDSVIWDCTGTKRTRVSTTPFIDTLRPESIVASNLYSHGPYTDAATKSLYTGRNTLDDFAYYFKLNSAPKTHFEVFHENGYETYGQYYPYYMYGQRIKNSIDHSYYTSGFLYGSEWGGIFAYYQEILAKRQLSAKEKTLLRKRTQLMFDVWMGFYRDVLDDPECSVIISDWFERSDIEEASRNLENEYRLFKGDPDGYVEGIITRGTDHVLASLDPADVSTNIDQEYMKTNIYGRYADFFSTVKKNTRVANIRHNLPSPARTVKGGVGFVLKRDRSKVRFASNFRRCLKTTDDMIANSRKEHWQNMPSARRQLDSALEVLKKRESSTPFYYSLHLLEPHEYISFFTYDTQDDEILAEEFGMLQSFVEGCGTDFKGSMPYLLSIRYVDYCIERFCKGLKELGLWDSTTLLLVADHGSSFSYYPLHGNQVNCFDEECYHIPMMIRSPGLKHMEVEAFCNSKDVFPTLFDVTGLEKPECFTGESIISTDFPKRNWVMTEYMGPGCPDMLTRQMWLSIRDRKYLVAYKAAVESEFRDGDLAEVYDLKKDPKGYYNIKDKIDKKEIQYLLEVLEQRFNEICSETKEFISTQLNGNS